ncbi:MAG: SCO family protein [Alphaproteobacteria bacterium]
MIRLVRHGLWLAVATIVLAIGVLLFLPQEEESISAGKPLGGPFRLVDFNGAPISEHAFQGHPSAVFFGYTHCPEVCPTTLFELDQWIAALGPDGEKLQAYFVTVDPERDTPELLKDYVTSVTGRVTGISGDPDAVRAMLKDYHIYFARTDLEGGDYAMDHSASVFLLNEAGDFTGTISYGEPTETAITKLSNLVR